MLPFEPSSVITYSVPKLLYDRFVQYSWYSIDRLYNDMRDACAGLRATNADADTDAERRQKQPLSGQPTNHSS